MSNPNPERDGRVAKIRERWSVKVSNTKSWGERPTLQSVGGMEGAMADIDYLLSLLDNQAAETFAGPCVGCGHSNYDVDQKECKQRWMEGNYSVVCGCPCAKHNSLANAATRMRDRCVERVKEYLRHAKNIDIAPLIDDLQSLALEQGEQEKR